MTPPLPTKSCGRVLQLGTTEAMETAGFLYLFAQSNNESDEKAICPLAFLILEK